MPGGWLALQLSDIPGGVAPNPGTAPGSTDNLILASPVTPNTFQHPTCGFGEEKIIATLPTDNPVGKPAPTTPTTPTTPQ